MKDKSLIKYRIISFIRTPFHEEKEVPIQVSYSSAEAWIELFPQYIESLAVLDGFSHLILLYYFHKTRDPFFTNHMLIILSCSNIKSITSP